MNIPKRFISKNLKSIPRNYEGLRYVIRDIDSKIPLVKFRSEWSSDSIAVIKMLYSSLNFGLNHFYEIFDREKKEVID